MKKLKETISNKDMNRFFPEKKIGPSVSTEKKIGLNDLIEKKIVCNDTSENKIGNLVEKKIEVYTCEDKCCSIKIMESVVQQKYKSIRGRCYKAGVLLHDSVNKSILLVLSRGTFWGCPKGTVESDRNETYMQCALREVEEETGIKLKETDLLKSVKIREKAVYYYTEFEQKDVFIQDTPENDADGLAWIKTECLKKLVNSGKIVLNYHTKIVIKEFLNISLFN